MGPSVTAGARRGRLGVMANGTPADPTGASAHEATATVETSFERLLGRRATEVERERLHRVRQVLGLRDNDGFWCIVLALAHHDFLFFGVPCPAGGGDRAGAREPSCGQRGGVTTRGRGGAPAAPPNWVGASTIHVFLAATRELRMGAGCRPAPTSRSRSRAMPFALRAAPRPFASARHAHA